MAVIVSAVEVDLAITGWSASTCGTEVRIRAGSLIGGRYLGLNFFRAAASGKYHWYVYWYGENGTDAQVVWTGADQTGNSGTGRIEIEASGSDLLWRAYVDGVEVASGTRTGQASATWDIVHVFDVSPAAAYDTRFLRLAVDHGITTTYPWDVVAEGDDWTLEGGLFEITGGYLHPALPSYVYFQWHQHFTTVLPSAEPSCAICQGRDGVFYAAVGVHTGSDAEPTISLYRCPAPGEGWELVSVAATPADLGGTGALAAWPSGSGGPTVAAQLGATIVQWMQQLPDGRLVIGLGRNAQRKVGTTVVSPDTWWLTSRDCGVIWDVTMGGLLGSGKRVSAFEANLAGDVHAHLIETPASSDINKARRWYARGRADTLEGLDETALGAAATATGVNPELVNGGVDELRSGELLARSGVGVIGAYGWSPAFGMWQFETASALAYSEAHTSPMTVAPFAGPAQAQRSDGTVDVVWRGYKQGGSPVDATHLWYRVRRAQDGYAALVYADAAPVSAVCALTQEEIAYSGIRVIAGADGAVNVFVNVWKADRVDWWRSVDGGVTWVAGDGLVW